MLGLRISLTVIFSVMALIFHFNEFGAAAVVCWVLAAICLFGIWILEVVLDGD